MALTLEGCRHRGQQQVTTSRRTCREPQRWGGGWAGGPFQCPGVSPLAKKGVYLTGKPPLPRPGELRAILVPGRMWKVTLSHPWLS